MEHAAADLVDWKEPAKLLGLKGRAFWDVTHNQGLPHYRINSRVIRFRMSEVEQWLSARHVNNPKQQNAHEGR